jgi:hypothetical protein
MSTHQSTPDEASEAKVNMTIVWSIVVFVVFVFGGIATPWDTIRDLLQNGGPTDEQKTVLAFVAGYTFPLTLAAGGLVYAGFAGWFDGMEGPYVLVTIAAVLIGAGFLAAELGLGRLPQYSLEGIHGPIYIAVFAFALQGYFNAYGWALMLCAVAVGTGCALQIREWQRSATA